jgi:hypothetical protein
MQQDVEIRKCWTERRAKMLQEMYADEPKRAYRWVTCDAKLKLDIPLEDIQEHFRERWEKESKISDSEIWKQFYSLNADQRLLLDEEICSIEGMLEVMTEEAIEALLVKMGSQTLSLKLEARILQSYLWKC